MAFTTEQTDTTTVLSIIMANHNTEYILTSLPQLTNQPTQFTNQQLGTFGKVMETSTDTFVDIKTVSTVYIYSVISVLTLADINTSSITQPYTILTETVIHHKPLVKSVVIPNDTENYIVNASSGELTVDYSIYDDLENIVKHYVVVFEDGADNFTSTNIDMEIFSKLHESGNISIESSTTPSTDGYGAYNNSTTYARGEVHKFAGASAVTFKYAIDSAGDPTQVVSGTKYIVKVFTVNSNATGTTRADYTAVIAPPVTTYNDIIRPVHCDKIHYNASTYGGVQAGYLSAKSGITGGTYGTDAIFSEPRNGGLRVYRLIFSNFNNPMFLILSDRRTVYILAGAPDGPGPNMHMSSGPIDQTQFKRCEYVDDLMGASGNENLEIVDFINCGYNYIFLMNNGEVYLFEDGGVTYNSHPWDNTSKNFVTTQSKVKLVHADKIARYITANPGTYVSHIGIASSISSQVVITDASSGDQTVFCGRLANNTDTMSASSKQNLVETWKADNVGYKIFHLFFYGFDIIYMTKNSDGDIKVFELYCGYTSQFTAVSASNAINIKFQNFLNDNRTDNDFIFQEDSRITKTNYLIGLKDKSSNVITYYSTNLKNSSAFTVYTPSSYTIPGTDAGYGQTVHLRASTHHPGIIKCWSTGYHSPPNWKNGPGTLGLSPLLTTSNTFDFNTVDKNSVLVEYSLNSEIIVNKHYVAVFEDTSVITSKTNSQILAIIQDVIAAGGLCGAFLNVAPIATGTGPDILEITHAIDSSDVSVNVNHLTNYVSKVFVVDDSGTIVNVGSGDIVYVPVLKILNQTTITNNVGFDTEILLGGTRFATITQIDEMWVFAIDMAGITDVETEVTNERLQEMVSLFLNDSINSDAFFHDSTQFEAGTRSTINKTFTKVFDNIGTTLVSNIDVNKEYMSVSVVRIGGIYYTHFTVPSSLLPGVPYITTDRTWLSITILDTVESVVTSIMMVNGDLDVNYYIITNSASITSHYVAAYTKSYVVNKTDTELYNTIVSNNTFGSGEGVILGGIIVVGENTFNTSLSHAIDSSGSGKSAISDYGKHILKVFTILPSGLLNVFTKAYEYSIGEYTTDKSIGFNHYLDFTNMNTKTFQINDSVLDSSNGSSHKIIDTTSTMGITETELTQIKYDDVRDLNYLTIGKYGVGEFALNNSGTFTLVFVVQGTGGIGSSTTVGEFIDHPTHDNAGDRLIVDFTSAVGFRILPNNQNTTANFVSGLDVNTNSENEIQIIIVSCSPTTTRIIQKYIGDNGLEYRHDENTSTTPPASPSSPVYSYCNSRTSSTEQGWKGRLYETMMFETDFSSNPADLIEIENIITNKYYGKNWTSEPSYQFTGERYLTAPQGGNMPGGDVGNEGGYMVEFSVPSVLATNSQYRIANLHDQGGTGRLIQIHRQVSGDTYIYCHYGGHLDRLSFGGQMKPNIKYRLYASFTTPRHRVQTKLAYSNLYDAIGDSNADNDGILDQHDYEFNNSSNQYLPRFPWSLQSNRFQIPAASSTFTGNMYKLAMFTGDFTADFANFKAGINMNDMIMAHHSTVLTLYLNFETHGIVDQSVNALLLQWNP